MFDYMLFLFIIVVTIVKFLILITFNCQIIPIFLILKVSFELKNSKFSD